MYTLVADGLDADRMPVVAIRGREELSKPYRFDVVVRTRFEDAAIQRKLRVRGWAEPISNAGGEEPWTITPAGRSQLSD